MIPEGVERGQVIGVETCKSCGAEIKLKVTKHGKLFGKCFNVIDENAKGHAKYCGHPEQYPLWKSTELINEYLKHIEGEKNVSIHNQEERTEPAGATEQPAGNDRADREPDNERKGIFGQIFGNGSAFD